MVVRALTWRRLGGLQRGGARLQRQTQARAGQSQLTQQDPHAAGHIPLTARALTHSVSLRRAGRERRGGTRWRTGGALLRPPPPRLVAISRRLTSRRRRHGRDVINGTSHGPPAAARRRPPEPALTAPLVREELSYAAPPALPLLASCLTVRELSTPSAELAPSTSITVYYYKCTSFNKSFMNKSRTSHNNIVFL